MFYGVASFMIMVVNKRVLTVYNFPSFQGTLTFPFSVPVGFRQNVPAR
jgi:hypothetical protein